MKKKEIDISSVAPNSNDKDNIGKDLLSANTTNDNKSSLVLAFNRSIKSDVGCSSLVENISNKEESSSIHPNSQLPISSSTKKNNIDCITHDISNHDLMLQKHNPIENESSPCKTNENETMNMNIITSKFESSTSISTTLNTDNVNVSNSRKRKNKHLVTKIWISQSLKLQTHLR